MSGLAEGQEEGPLSDNTPYPDATLRNAPLGSETHPQVGAGSHQSVEGLPRGRKPER